MSGLRNRVVGIHGDTSFYVRPMCVGCMSRNIKGQHDRIHAT